MFKKGKSHCQKSVFDFDYNMSNAMKKKLQKSWAYNFFENVYTQINEERFACLYSNSYSRPNTPINLLISLFIIKDITDMTDEELIEALYFDYRFHYALGIEDIERERICINTITNFRARLLRYEQSTGIDLLYIELKELSMKLAESIDLDMSLARMDSFMIASTSKKLSVIELIYVVIKNMINTIAKTDKTLIPEGYEVYLSEEHQKEALYRTHKDKLTTKTDFLFSEAIKLFEIMKQDHRFNQTVSYQHLERLLKERCDEKENKIIPRKQKKVASTVLQNPSDEDATFRKKADESHVGYVANVTEVRDKEKILE